MNIYNKIFIGSLLFISIGSQNIFSMHAKTPCPVAASREDIADLALQLKMQLAISTFIVMRVDIAPDSVEKHWKSAPLEDKKCCRTFRIPTEENKRKHLSSITKYFQLCEMLTNHGHEVVEGFCRIYPLNEAFTDLHFTRRLLDHLDELYRHEIVTPTGPSDHQKQVIIKIAYEMLCTLSSLWPPTNLSNDQNQFINRLSTIYTRQESFIGIEVSIEDIISLIDMNKALLLKLLDYKFLRSYPCDYKNNNEAQFGKGYLKRENFCTHYIDEHCIYLDRYNLYCILNWFRLESLELSPKEVYDFVLNYFEQESSSYEECSENSSTS